MKSNFIISIYHDTRRPKANGLFPVKIRVFSIPHNTAKLYPTDYDLSIQEFQSIWLTTKPRSEYRERRIALQAIETKANDTAKSLKPFAFETFRNKLYASPREKNDVLIRFSERINKLKKDGRIGTAESYSSTLGSLKKFMTYRSGKTPGVLLFQDISAEWLNEYERYMIEIQKTGRTTVGIYLRNVRTIFNLAIDEKQIDNELYPFGKKKYRIPAGRKTKKALAQKTLQVLFNSKPSNEEQNKARAFWFFSYSCNGMNIKDIARLKYTDIKGSTFTFYRAKTINTTKEDLRTIQVHLTSFAKTIIQKYGNKAKDSYVFDIINDSMSEEEKHKSIRNFTRFINQHIQAFAKAQDITDQISTYSARHSFSTNIIRQGGSMEFVSEALGHSDTKTTMNYFAGFESNEKKTLIEKLMKFK